MPAPFWVTHGKIFHMYFVTVGKVSWRGGLFRLLLLFLKRKCAQEGGGDQRSWKQLTRFCPMPPDFVCVCVPPPHFFHISGLIFFSFVWRKWQTSVFFLLGPVQFSFPMPVLWPFFLSFFFFFFFFFSAKFWNSTFEKLDFVHFFQQQVCRLSQSCKGVLHVFSKKRDCFWNFYFAVWNTHTHTEAHTHTYTGESIFGICGWCFTFLLLWK